MSGDKPEKPLPSPEEINAYLELSAARTRKRLPLAFAKAGATGAARNLRIAEQPAEKPEQKPGPLPVVAPKGTAAAPASAPHVPPAEAAWQPFDDTDGGKKSR